MTQKETEIKDFFKTLTEIKQDEREKQLQYRQFEKEIKRLTDHKGKLSLQLVTHQEELEVVVSELIILEAEIPIIEDQLNTEQQQLAELRKSQTNSEWQEIQSLIKTQEDQLYKQEKYLRQEEEKLKDNQGRTKLIQQKINEEKQLIEWNKSKELVIINEQQKKHYTIR